MSAGYIQLAALGTQDIYLTGEPQVTYFAGVYRRHTPFVLEAYDIPFLGQNVNYGSKSICRIPPQGDLIRAMTLKLTLPQLSNAQTVTNWYWPIPPSASNVAQIVVNSYNNAANTAPYGGVTWYSTYNLSAPGTDQWLNSTAGSYGPMNVWVTYSNTTNKFTFSNVGGGSLTSIWVRPSSGINPLTNSGVFWGLDPLQANVVVSNTQTAGNIWYGYAVTNNTFTCPLTLEQAGWLTNPTPGLPPAASRTGLFLQSNASVPISSGLSYLNLSTIDVNGTNSWTNWDFTPSFSVTPGGRISFSTTGLYLLKVGFGLATGSMSNVSWGTSVGDGTAGSTPALSASYEWRVSPNPSSPAVFPMAVTSTSSNLYIYTSGTGSTIASNSYIALNPVDDYLLLTSNIAQYQNPQKIPFVGNIFSTGSATTSKLTDGSLTFTFATAGTYLFTGVIQMSNGYVLSSTIGEGANIVYTYDMSSQGRDPTFAFNMPVIVTDTARKYYINVACSNTTANIQAGSFYAIQQIGIPFNSTTGTQGILPWAGLTFQSNTNTLSSPLRLNTTDFVSNGYVYIESLSGTTNLTFSNVGTYMLTGALCTADQVTSISINTVSYANSVTSNIVTTYPVSLGLRPPYTVNIPFRISNLTTTNTTITVTTNGVTAAPNVFSNTFLTVVPFAINTTTVTQFSYYDSVGTLAIQSAELKIGGQSIQTLTGEAIEIWNDLNVSYENQPALTVMTGKRDTSNAISQRTYYVNLPFYFYGFPELSIPVVALDRQDIEVHVTFNNFSNLTSITALQNPNLSTPPLYATIITEYVYLAQPEINWFKSNRIEQVITQWQYQNYPLAAGSAGGVFALPFINPVRELFFVVQNATANPYDYTNSGFLSLGLTFNGYDAFTSTTTDATYMGVLEPYNHYPTFPSRKFYMYSFCVDANTSKPTGFVNFSRIKQILMTLNVDPTRNVPRTFRVLGVNFNVLRIENGLAGLMYNSS
jgi:Large eukaryotic DNA virus major capsid protein/Major capsid protein N-terminus